MRKVNEKYVHHLSKVVQQVSVGTGEESVALYFQLCYWRKLKRYLKTEVKEKRFFYAPLYRRLSGGGISIKGVGSSRTFSVSLFFSVFLCF